MTQARRNSPRKSRTPAAVGGYPAAHSNVWTQANLAREMTGSRADLTYRLQ
jgi:hypothetical protein